MVHKAVHQRSTIKSKRLVSDYTKRTNASFLVFLQEAFQAEIVVTSVGVVAKLCHDHALCTRQSFDQPFS